MTFTRPRLRPRALATTVATLLIATLVAAGCGSGGLLDGSGGGSGADAGVAGLALVPEDALAVGVAWFDEASLDQALETLDRFPIWGMAEAELGVESGAEARERAIEAILADSDLEGEVTVGDVEAWLGDHVTIAALGGLEQVVAGDQDMEGDVPTFAVLLHVTDEGAAAQFLGDQLGDEWERSTHRGTTIVSQEDEGAAFVAADVIALVPARAQAEALLDHHAEGDPTFASREGVGEMLSRDEHAWQLASATAIDRLLDIGALAARTEAESMGDPDEAEQLTTLADLIEEDAVRELVPDVMGGAMVLDETGLRQAYGWAPAAEPSIDDARELAERMPADTQSVQAGASSSSFIDALPGAWAEASEAYDVEVSDAFTGCEPAWRDACDLAERLLVDALEGDLLERLDEISGEDGATAMATSTTIEGSGIDMRSSQETVGVQRVADVDATLQMLPDGAEALQEALGDHGVEFEASVEGDDTHVGSMRLLPDGEIAREFDQQTLGFMLRSQGLGGLLDEDGIAMAMRPLDDSHVAFAMPASALDDTVEAWEDDAARIGDDEGYVADVEAAGAPDETSYFTWMDLAESYGQVFDMLGDMGQDAGTAPDRTSWIVPSPTAESGGGMQPDVFASIASTNLEHVGGLVGWTTRDGDTGTLHLVIPIEE